eukprot:g10602.t1
MAPSERDGPSDQVILREVSAVLRLADDPNQMTFRQVRLAVEESLGLPEESLRNNSKERIKNAVHTVMDELDREAVAEEKEEDQGQEQDNEEEEEEFTGIRPFEVSAAGAPPGGIKKRGRIGVFSSEIRPSAKRAGETSTRGEEWVEGKKKAVKAGENKIKKTRKKAGSGGGSGGGEEDSDGMVCVLSETASGRRQVNVDEFKGHILVNIREYYRNKEQVFAPAFKGIALNRSQWEALRSATKLIDRAVDKLS